MSFWENVENKSWFFGDKLTFLLFKLTFLLCFDLKTTLWTKNGTSFLRTSSDYIKTGFYLLLSQWETSLMIRSTFLSFKGLKSWKELSNGWKITNFGWPENNRREYMMTYINGICIQLVDTGRTWDKRSWGNSRKRWRDSMEEIRLEANIWSSTEITWFWEKIIDLCLLVSILCWKFQGLKLTTCSQINTFGHTNSSPKMLNLTIKDKSSKLLFFCRPIIRSGKGLFYVPYVDTGFKTGATSAPSVVASTMSFALLYTWTVKSNWLVVLNAEVVNLQ